MPKDFGEGTEHPQLNDFRLAFLDPPGLSRHSDVIVVIHGGYFVRRQAQVAVDQEVRLLQAVGAERLQAPYNGLLKKSMVEPMVFCSSAPRAMGRPGIRSKSRCTSSAPG